MVKLRVVMCLLLAAALVVGGCGKADRDTAGTRTDGDQTTEEPIIIGAIFSATGDNAPLGVPEKQTVEMLAKQLNEAGGVDGRQVKVLFYDDAGQPETAVQACQKLLAEKNLIAIIGPTLSGPSLAIADACEKQGVPLVSCAASVKIVEPVKPNVFKTAQSDSLAVERLLDYMKTNNIKSIGFINDSNAYGSSGRDQWVAVSKGSEVRTVAMESFNTGDTKMTSQLTKIKALNPDAVLCWGTNPGPAIVARDMKTLGMKMPLLMSHGIANIEFIDLAGSAAEGVVFPAGKLLVAEQIPDSDPQKQVLLKYKADFQNATGKGPNTFGGHAWDAFNMVVDAVKEVGPDRAKVREQIETIDDFVGITGVFSMSEDEHNGLTKDAFTMVTIKNGKWMLAQ